MVKIFLYGHLKKLHDPNSSYFENKPLIFSVGNITLKALLEKLKIKDDSIGEIFIDGTVVSGKFEEVIIEEDTERLAIFPLGMHLLCGGQHLKGHGFITKKPDKKMNYW
ncbi:MAG: hypothetical protein ACTSW1_18720 [Candidatus Hodarchaeales archaeon]